MKPTSKSKNSVKSSAVGALFIALIPGMLFLPAAFVFNTKVLIHFSPDKSFLPHTISRINVFTIIFFSLGLFYPVLFFLGKGLKWGNLLKKHPRFIGFLFAINLTFLFLLCLDAVIGIKLASPMLSGFVYPDPLCFFRYYPEHDRLYFQPMHVDLKNPADPGALSKRRIIFMGDSVVYGHGIEKDQTIPFYLGLLMKDSCEIMNGGVMAYDFHHYVYYARELVPLKPDEVILGICLNDLSFSKKSRLTHSPKNPKCTVQPVTRWNFVKWWLKCYSGLLNLDQIKYVINTPKNEKERGEYTINSLVALLSDPKKFHEQELICRHYMKDIAEQMKKNNIQFSVVIFPFRFQYVESDTQRWSDHAKLQQAFLDICSSLDIRAIDLRGDLERIMKEKGYSPDDVYLDYDHFNPNGCREMAEIIYSYYKNPEQVDKEKP